MGICVAKNGDVLPDVALKEMIINSEFEVAHYLVSKFITKRDIKRLHKKIILNVGRNKVTLDLSPRGFGKSTIGDVDFCITCILRNPNIRILIGSKTQAQAEAFLREIRAHFEQNLDLIRVFGSLISNRWTDKEFVVKNRSDIKKEGTVTALGASGAVVSKHFDIIVADDLVGFENARTKGQQDKLKEWFYSSLYPTLEPDGELHVLGTRYHPNDLYQDFINSGNYAVQVQKAINVDDNGNEYSLWEEKFSLETLKTIKKESGSIIFGMQYQNSVELAKGDIFKPEYFNYYGGYDINYVTNEVLINNKSINVYMGIDLAISQSDSADYFVIMVIGKDKDNNIYVLDYYRDKLTFDKQFNKIVEYGQVRFPMVERIGIETVAYQLAMAQELRRYTSLPVINIKTSKDKVSRALRRSALFENGKVFLKENMAELENELLLFSKNGDYEHDDLFDGLDFALTVADQNSLRVLDRQLFNI